MSLLEIPLLSSPELSIFTNLHDRIIINEGWDNLQIHAQNVNKAASTLTGLLKHG